MEGLVERPVVSNTVERESFLGVSRDLPYNASMNTSNGIPRQFRGKDWSVASAWRSDQLRTPAGGLLIVVNRQMPKAIEHRRERSHMTLIVFHWRLRYSQKAQNQAFREGREASVDDMIADGNEEPLYSCSVFAVPPCTPMERHKLRRLIERAGFRRDEASGTWTARCEGETSAVALKAGLDAARFCHVHYHDIPPAFIVDVNLDGLL
ncbi:hypothetical protein Rhsp01_34230 [Rhizobium sp. NBRC 114257]|uniref:Uncharacterized protein n=1 Tax=Rhizobium dioscoreae TaxID=2653122 RepID=A0ABQ0Z3X6_9HYPH|nr:hypothetical protein RsS93_26070 [Rhizobium dioscoreae]GLU82247.1 hypothetical protein Rhsp01_34230 [Rhizobium sp. NBRC 114257]